MRRYTHSTLALLAVLAGCAADTRETVDEPYVDGILSAPVLVTDAFERNGELTAALPGRSPQTFRVTLRETVEKGGGDTELALENTGDGTSTAFTLEDESASGTLTTPDGSLLTAEYNEDESVTVGSGTYATPEEAATAMFTSPEAASVTPEALLIASTLLGDEDEDTAATTDRGAVKRAVKWVWKRITSSGVCVTWTRYSDGSDRVGFGC